MNKFSVKAVVIGALTDIVATNLVTIPFFIYVMASRNLGSIPKDQIASATIEAVNNDPALFFIQIFLGSLCSVFGGYIAARIAKRHEVLNGALASFLCIVSGLYALVFGSVSMPLWQHLAAFVASPALSALGGYLRVKTDRSQAPAY